MLFLVFKNVSRYNLKSWKVYISLLKNSFDFVDKIEQIISQKSEV